MNKITAAITAVGGYVPETKLTNFDLEKMVDTNDEWIRTRTGISERRILREPGKASSDLAVPAIQEILSTKMKVRVKLEHLPKKADQLQKYFREYFGVPKRKSSLQTRP